MTTINNYSVSLSMEASDYIRKSNLSASATRALKREIEQSRTPAERYELQVRRLDRALSSGAITQGTYNRLLAQQKSLLTTNASAFSGMATKLAGISAAYFSVNSAIGFLKDGLQLFASNEQAQIAFEVMLKDAKLAESMLRNLRAFAAVTPFSEDEVIRSARSLLAFGFSAEQTNKQLGILGNISAATGIDLTELSMIIGKMRTQNTIFAEDLNQLAGRGINVINGLAERLGISAEQVKKFASESKIKFEDLNAVLTDIANNDFGGMIARQAETLQGKWSTLNDQFNRTKRLFTELLAGGEGGGLVGRFLRGAEKNIADINAALNVLNFGHMDDIIASNKDAAATYRDLANKKWGGTYVSPQSKKLGDLLNRQRRENMLSSLGGLGSDAAGAVKTQVGAAQMTATALGAGLMQLGTSIAGSFQVHTEKLQQAIKGDLAPSLEAGSAEAAAAILKAQAESVSRSDSPERKQISLLESLGIKNDRTNMLLEQMTAKLEPAKAWR